MTRTPKHLLLLVAFLPAGLFAQTATQPARIPSIEDRTAGMQRIDGYFPLYWDARAGNLYLEIPRFDSEFLLTTGLAAGLGSNDLGLDRGISGASRIVTFNRVGPKVLLIQNNERFRAGSANPAERRSVEDSFAKSVRSGSPMPRNRAAASWWTPPTSSYAMVATPAPFFAPGRIAWTARVAPSTYRVPRHSRRTPKSKCC
jgi:hypothetical protein